MIWRATEYVFDELIPMLVAACWVPIIVWVAWLDGLTVWRK